MYVHVYMWGRCVQMYQEYMLSLTAGWTPAQEETASMVLRQEKP